MKNPFSFVVIFCVLLISFSNFSLNSIGEVLLEMLKELSKHGNLLGMFLVCLTIGFAIYIIVAVIFDIAEWISNIFR